MSSSKNIVLEAKNISKYFGTITALENVNLTVREGECLGVVGDNGAGKSTFMKVLSGLYKPSSGSLFFDGNKEILNSFSLDISFLLYVPKLLPLFRTVKLLPTG